jgi:HEPN domain-containing protein
MAQQTAELGLKAVYQARGWQFPFTHNLGHLLDGLTANGVDIPRAVQEADRLTFFAVQGRYPGTTGFVSQEEFEAALAVAESVLKWAESQVE